MAVSAEQHAWVQRVLGLDLPPAESGLIAAQVAWSRRREDVVTTLKGLETAIRKMNDPDGDEAIILVRAIAANLTPMPDSKSSIAELRRYLATDRIIGDAELPNGFGIRVQIRAPLLGALDALDTAMPA
jgi:hypothetical protein